MERGLKAKVLTINLGDSSFSEEIIDKDLIKFLLGGPGFGIDYLLREKTYEVAALSEQNPLVFMTGLLTGTAYPCSGFFSVSAKSPLTEIYGEGLSGGFFGAQLRRVFNGLIFKEKAETPVYLYIDDENYELRDATELWGLDTKSTMRELQTKLGADFRISCIGPAGEKQIPLAAIINDHGRAVGRCGMGAAMGFKKLKAIAVRSKAKIEYYDELKFREIAKKLFQTFKESPMAGILRGIGTNGIDYFEMIADVPHKNWALGKWREVSKIAGSVVAKKMLVRLRPCYLCPFSCGREVAVNEGPYKVSEAAGPEYETVAAFGSQCLNSNIESIAYLNDYCNQMGVDTISTGCTVAFAIDCFEKGILTEEDLGFPLAWGDPDAIIRLTELICKNEGIGRILSQGTRKAARQIGKGADNLLVEIKGLELPMHDPRANYALGLQYATANRGACHLRGFGSDIYSGFAKFQKPFGVAEEVPIQLRTVDNPTFAKDIAIGQNLSEVNNALGICRQTISSGSQIFENLFELLLDAIYYLTGLKFTLPELTEIGARIFNLKRLFNVRCGITRADDRIPPRLKVPLSEGFVKNKSLTIDAMLEAYYKFRGWDQDGIPTKNKLMELQISEY
ncbi:MAG: aldehyde ferredoxin oxidoreductase family protein [Candidatus Helarchaeota archaeon]|nr:aldehyde ferredoxin oxidoreductase family protein [Candidatus Helarchaeota archaeon]